MNSQDRIIDAACTSIADDGIAGLTVAGVARRAKVSSALVHYHFSTKEALVHAAGERLAARRNDARVQALAGASGLEALDALWVALEAGAASGAERACGDLALLARTDRPLRKILTAQKRPALRALTDRLPGLFAELGAAEAAPAEEAATLVTLLLDGVAIALAAGDQPAEVRAAYDAFWLAWVKAGQARGR